MDFSEEINKARAYFPRGLEQPLNSFRFSIDALLLASFAAKVKGENVLELGTGCGVVSLALLLFCLRKQILGIDISSDLVQVANNNAKKMGLEQFFLAKQVDICRAKPEKLIQPESFSLVLSNPPYRELKQGRLPEKFLCKQALFEITVNLAAIAELAAYSLVNQGVFCCIYPSNYLEKVILTFKKYNLICKELLPIYSFGQIDSCLTLIKAVKNTKCGLKILAPLTLYENIEQNKQQVLTKEALEFCHFLGCNALKE